MSDMNQRHSGIRKKWKEMLISRRLAIEARRAARDATNRSLDPGDGEHIAVPPPLIPATPMARRAPAKLTPPTALPTVWDKETWYEYWEGLHEVRSLAQIRIPMHLLNRMESDVAKDIKHLREEIEEQELRQAEEEDEDAQDDDGHEESMDDDEEQESDQQYLEAVEAEHVAIAGPPRRPLTPIQGNGETLERMETAVQNMTPAQAMAIGSYLATRGQLPPSNAPPLSLRPQPPMPGLAAATGPSTLLPHPTFSPAPTNQAPPGTVPTLIFPVQAPHHLNQLPGPLQHPNPPNQPNPPGPSIVIMPPTPTLPPPGINRRPPSPIKTNELSSLLRIVHEGSQAPAISQPDGTPVLIYYPKIVGGEGDAVMLGIIKPGSPDISLSHAVLLKTSIWTVLLRRVQARAWSVLESYVCPQNIPDGKALSGKTSHEHVYEKLSQVYAFMSSCVNREQDLTKRWKVTKGPVTESERGAVWEGYGVQLDKGLSMSREERRGAIRVSGLETDLAERKRKEDVEMMDDDEDEFESEEDEGMSDEDQDT
ncbi:hypothetical protein BDV96DRAFT_570588 [Lophiotrema nucula]|uniref:Uncharacterized protein n=1 Tax=Lophiotrema nucula TaxID=690887 RepID=A0A6A5ZEW3_9PLEO|nr:hypothetical protein BDV96DRAFT_570588 [Lophiotrema nucula]